MGRDSLNEKQRQFVETYLATGNSHKAAMAAGYKSKSCGTKLLTRKTIAAAIAEARAELAKKNAYTMEKAMDEAKEAMDFSLRTKNANAYVKAVELRSKLMGLLIERSDVRQVGGFSIQIQIPELPKAAVTVTEKKNEPKLLPSS